MNVEELIESLMQFVKVADDAPERRIVVAIADKDGKWRCDADVTVVEADRFSPMVIIGVREEA